MPDNETPGRLSGHFDQAPGKAEKNLFLHTVLFKK